MKSLSSHRDGSRLLHRFFLLSKHCLMYVHTHTLGLSNTKLESELFTTIDQVLFINLNVSKGKVNDGVLETTIQLMKHLLHQADWQSPHPFD